MNGTPFIDYDVFVNVVDVTLVSFILYRALLIVRGTRASPVLGGLALVIILYFVASYVGLLTLAWLLNKVLASIIVVVVVVFQDEIRLALRKVGLQPIFPKSERSTIERALEDIALASVKIAKANLGALIVIQREVGLSDLTKEGVVVDALVNRKLLFSIFAKESPLHDGAVLIVGDRLRAAGCVLPLTHNPDLDPNLGTRHRAALGISEQSDAVVIVVSEETGSISVAREGRLVRNVEPSNLRETLERWLERE